MPPRRPGPLGPLLILACLALAPAPPAGAGGTMPIEPTGSLTGRVRFVGVAPRLDALTIATHRDVCGERQLSEALVVGANGGIEGAVVRVEGVTWATSPASTVVLDTVGCRFVPHVAIAGPGTRVLVRNSDPILHNAQGLLDGEVLFNVAIPRAPEVIDVTRRLWSPGVVRVQCGVHPHMSAWLVVHDSPYIAVTDRRGAFTLAGIPPGTYRVTLWHEGFRPRPRRHGPGPTPGLPVRMARTVRIEPGGATRVEFRLQ